MITCFKRGCGLREGPQRPQSGPAAVPQWAITCFHSPGAGKQTAHMKREDWLARRRAGCGTRRTARWPARLRDAPHTAMSTMHRSVVASPGLALQRLLASSCFTNSAAARSSSPPCSSAISRALTHILRHLICGSCNVNVSCGQNEQSP